MYPFFNLRRTYCPTCSEPLPFFRFPKSLRQAFFGGWTCPACRTETDRWGRRLA